ncbi:hypothetical protein GGF43_000888 [Coemansia sp. RSA 2618]|nr:hypothetical protein GGF43_000888 [Coemansia sp. RSA 2618]
MTQENSSDSSAKQQPKQAQNNARQVPKHDLPATRLFKVLNPELFMKPNRLIMYGGAIAVGGIILWLGSGELKHRQSQAVVDVTSDSPESVQRPQTYQERMAEAKRSSK